MPVEIHKGAFIFDKPQPKLDVSLMTMDWEQNSQRPKPISPSLRHNFAHDLESLWWIIVWIVLIRVKGAKWLRKMIFIVLDFPHPHREAFFKKVHTLQDHPEHLIHDTLRGCNTHTFLAIYNLSLCEFYATGVRQDATSYHSIYGTVWAAMEHFVRKVSCISMELEDPSKRAPPSPVSFIDPQDLGKRARSIENDDMPDKVTTAKDGSSRKRQKSGGDVFIDTDEESTAEENTIDMAGIAREDSNPRIRSTRD
jgi:hypothetical protein